MNNFKNRSPQGFTIVELLIVIVVIAILAAITIVAYNGIQNRAKATSGQSLASQMDKKAEIYNSASSTGGYPANVAAFASGPKESVLDDATAIVDYSATAGNPGVPTVAANYSDGKKVIYRLLGATTGGCIYWWDYAAGTPIQKPAYFGSVTTGC